MLTLAPPRQDSWCILAMASGTARRTGGSRRGWSLPTTWLSPTAGWRRRRRTQAGRWPRALAVRESCPPSIQGSSAGLRACHLEGGPLGPADSSLGVVAAHRCWSGHGQLWGGGLCDPFQLLGEWGGRPVSGTHNRNHSTSRVAVSCPWILRHRVLTGSREGLARLSGWSRGAGVPHGGGAGSGQPWAEHTQASALCPSEDATAPRHASTEGQSQASLPWGTGLTQVPGPRGGRLEGQRSSGVSLSPWLPESVACA